MLRKPPLFSLSTVGLSNGEFKHIWRSKFANLLPQATEAKVCSLMWKRAGIKITLQANRHDIYRRSALSKVLAGSVLTVRGLQVSLEQV
jgi:hypothetical protein